MKLNAAILILIVMLSSEAFTQRTTWNHGGPRREGSQPVENSTISPWFSVVLGGSPCPTPLTGNLSSDLILLRSAAQSNSKLTIGNPKSPIAAGLLSMALPGLGQAYSEDWSLSWKSLAFLGAEIALWTGYAIYKADADEQTTLFQAYADEHWSVVEYTNWIRTNIGQLNPQVNPNNIIISSDASLPPWERVDWTELNRVEEGIGRVTGTGFTHRLPVRPEQQYYELIGKYAQYGGGWDDASGFTPSDLLADRVSQRFLDYSKMRGKANDLYYTATTITTVIVVNHLLSALEAAWSTSRNNRRIETEAKLKMIDQGGRRSMTAIVETKVRF